MGCRLPLHRGDFKRGGVRSPRPTAVRLFTPGVEPSAVGVDAHIDPRTVREAGPYNHAKGKAMVFQLRHALG